MEGSVSLMFSGTPRICDHCVHLILFIIQKEIVSEHSQFTDTLQTPIYQTLHEQYCTYTHSVKTVRACTV